mgnify:CR=1 FL=1
MEKERKKNLEEAIKEKVSPLLEETMEKSWGITIPKIETDISDKLKNPQLEIYIPNNLSFSQAKNKFKSEFLKRELLLNQGNVSHLAKLLGIDRRSIHRVIKDLNINIEELRHIKKTKEEYQQGRIDQTIRTTLDQYKEIIQPQQMEKMYQQVSNLSRNIAKFLPLTELNWKEAQQEFEKQFISKSLEKNNGNMTKAADDLKIRIETLYRKVKKIRLEKN